MRMYRDGFPTTLTFSSLPDVSLYEKAVVTPGLSMGGPIPTTSMRNRVSSGWILRSGAWDDTGRWDDTKQWTEVLSGVNVGSYWRTFAPRALKSLSPVTSAVAFDFAALSSLAGAVGVNQLVTVHFPDGASILFWGWIEEFTPGAFTEGEQPTGQLVIQPSNRDEVGLETPPVFDDITVTLRVDVEEIGEFLFKPLLSPFIVRVSNLSTNDAASDVVVTINLPASFDYVSSSHPTAQAGQVLTVTIGTLNYGDEAEIEITVIPSEAGGFIVEASVTTSSLIREEASVLTNDWEFEVFDLSTCEPVSIGSPDFSNSGGDLFDCYPVGDVVDGVIDGNPALPLLAGSGFVAGSQWIVADVVAETESIPTLDFWYKPGVGVYSDLGTTPATDGADVLQWNDQSGNGYHLTSLSAFKPIFRTDSLNEYPSIDFWNSSQSTALTHAQVLVGSAGGVTVLAVLRQDAVPSVGSFRMLICLGSAVHDLRTTSLSHVPEYVHGGSVSAGGAFPVSGFSRVMFSHDDANDLQKIKVNGSGIVSSADATAWEGAQQLVIGARPNQQFPFRGHVVEVLGFVGSLSDDEIDDVFAYFALKYQI